MKDADTILVLGHRGKLGQAVLQAGGESCLTLPGGRESFDITNEQTVRRAVAESGCPLVINCIGYNDVDRAESEPDLARAVNALGPEALAKTCADYGVYLVQLSSDFVFSGPAQRPWRENDPVNPVSVYARSKLEGESRVLTVLPAALVVRSAWLFGPGRPGFVQKVLAQAQSGEPVPVVTDETGSPTYSPDLARALLTLARKRVSGILHVVNTGQASRFELARQSLRLAGMDPDLVQPVTAAEMGRPAARPSYSVLDTRRLARVMGEALPSWLDALGRFLSPKREA
jgi:dTDP-4-dehydrorhamnose reductase